MAVGNRTPFKRWIYNGCVKAAELAISAYLHSFVPLPSSKVTEGESFIHFFISLQRDEKNLTLIHERRVKSHACSVD